MGMMRRHGKLSRLDDYIEADPPPGVDGPCWLYQGALNEKGYGPHRASYEAHVGPIPVGHHLDHRCRRRPCIQWRHLEPVTQSENERRKPLRARVQRGELCARGHALVGVNRIPGGECRLCR